MHPMRWLLLAITLGLTACSMGTRLAYNNLDTLMLLEVGGTVDLDAPQKAALKREFRKAWDWHRSTQLASYAETLRAMATTLDERAPQRADVDRLADQFDGFSKAVEQQAVPALARLLPLLDDAQVAEIAQEQTEDLEEDLAKHADESLAERQTRLAEEIQDKLDDWLGRVLPAQRAIVARRVAEAQARNVISPEQRRAEVLEAIASFNALLATRAEPGFEARLQRFGDTDSPAAKAKESEGRERFRRYFADLGATLDTRQRRHLAQRLRGLAEDFETLAAKAVASPA